VKVHSQFLTAASDPRQFPPPGPPEIAFLGRSNVGKSSTINSLLGSKIAKTSSTPGRTRSINFFAVRWPGRPKPDLLFVDLPGYGYAKIAREVSSQWPSFIEPYLRERPNLALCVALIDSNIPAQPTDRQLVDFLQATGRNFVIVATKSDRVPTTRLHGTMGSLFQSLKTTDILPYSAKTGAGRDELWSRIRTAAQSFSQPASADPVSNDKPA
jgi:GTP-binding protein